MEMGVTFKSIILLVVGFTFTKCTQLGVEPVKIKDNESKLVIFSLISPGKDTFVNIRKTIPITDEFNFNVNQNIDTVNNANVWLKNLTINDSTQLSQVAPSIYFVKHEDFPIIHSNKYEISIRYKNTITKGVCEVPSILPIIGDISISLEPEKSIIQNGVSVLTEPLIKVKITPLNSIIDFSQLALFERRVDFNSEGEIERELIFEYLDKNNSSPNGSFMVTIPYKRDPFIKKILEFSLIYLDKIPLDFYRTERLINEQRINFERFPLFAFNSIYPSPTNITNGYGYFQAYTSSEINRAILTYENDTINF